MRLTDRSATDDAAQPSALCDAAVIDAIADEIAVLDADGVIRRCNAAWQAFADQHAAAGQGAVGVGVNFLERLEARGKSGAATHRETAEAIRAIIAGALASFQVEMPCLSAAEPQWYLVQVRPLRTGRVGAVLTKQNITALRRAQADAQAAAEQLRLQSAALDAAANAVVIADADGTIRWANPAFTTLTGYPVSQAAGKRPSELLKSGMHDAAFYRHMWATILAGDIWRGEVVNRRRDGTLYTEEMTITPVRDARGAITHFIAVKQDVTQRKHLEEQFRQAQKMESIGRLAGGVAHDFNNQLSVILGHADIALEALEADHPVRDDLEAVRQAAQRSAELTRQLLTFARKKAVLPRVLDVNERVEASIRMLQRLIGEHVQLEWWPGDVLWPVCADATQLDQILTNLCVNARDAIDGSGTVRIATRNVTLTRDVCDGIADAWPGDFVQIEVADSGTGIDPAVLPSIFEPFFTTKPVGQGTGLGLASVYGAVRQSNGFIHVESQLRHGTTFSIYLPRHQPEGEAQ